MTSKKNVACEGGLWPFKSQCQKVNVLNTHLNYKKHFIYQNIRQMLDINEMYFLKSAPGMHFVILVQYAVVNEMGRTAFSRVTTDITYRIPLNASRNELQ